PPSPPRRGVKNRVGVSRGAAARPADVTPARTAAAVAVGPTSAVLGPACDAVDEALPPVVEDDCALGPGRTLPARGWLGRLGRLGAAGGEAGGGGGGASGGGGKCGGGGSGGTGGPGGAGGSGGGGGSGG